MRTTSPLHAVTWLVWAIAAAASVQIAPNPLYVAVVLAISFLVVSAHRLDTTLSRAFPILVGLGVVFALLRVTLTALTTPGLSQHVWFTLPAVKLPQLLGGFTVGGPIGKDVILFAAAQAFAVVGILGAFGVFNAVASHHELVQAAPRAFHEPGLILTVALAFVPSTMRAVTDAREADRARTGGRVVRRGRLIRLTVPILESGLERAVALAESMDARGFARQPRGRGDRASAWLGLVAMLSLGGSFVALIGRASGMAIAFGTVGVVTLLAAVVLASRSSATSRYRPRRLTRLDVAVGAGVLLAPLGLTVVGAVWDEQLYWTADPLVFPPFSLAAVACLAVLAIPVLVPPVPAVATDPQPSAAPELVGAS